MKRIKLSGNIASNALGYSNLISALGRIIENPPDELELDMQGVTWFDANLASVLAACLLSFDARSLTIKEPSTEVAKILNKNGSLRRFTGKVVPDENNTVVKYRLFGSQDHNEFYQYIQDDLFRISGLPSMSSALKERITQNFLEIFGNCHEHGGCDNVFVCGQFFPQRHDLIFTITNAGRTVRENVQRHHIHHKLSTEGNLDAIYALKWIMQGNSTRIGQLSSGMGLKELRAFLRLNGGSLQMVSETGYYEFCSGTPIVQPLSYHASFSGAIVTVKIKTNDSAIYTLANE